ncbi:hypothetical protein LQ327_18165 [Actinomycetospora endophytica]|uniref:Transcriptional regulator n=1 Tax=Actinomycetospora endophytica TaxID=2291215 RepID=A0ABS8PAJ6_9PSEU|nr:hypothetical protein [Actinomycetospora endophytica]MCD2195297.1 hypothetical protein [Actinomycetospora endophytica]
MSRNASLPFELGGPQDGRGEAEILLYSTVDGRPVAVADHWYRRWHNSWDSEANARRMMARHTVTMVKLPQSYPRMTVKLRGGGAWSAVTSVLGGVGAALDPVNALLGGIQQKLFSPQTVDLTLGHPPFDEKFEIVATDPDVARSLLGPLLVEEQASGRAPTWTIQGSDLYTLQGSSPIVPEEIPARLSALLRVADLLGH